jgi:oligoribonuclease NrnB/cAMP/cGMP phosphodiesterase (DHH superfamily)
MDLSVNENQYGGIKTYYKDLRVGCHFYVNNGGWSGRIVEIDGVKKVKIDEMDRTIDIDDDSYAWMTIEQNLKIKLFTHTDLDGTGCAILGEIAFNNIDIEFCNYNDINEKVKGFILSEEYKNYDIIFITDISVDEEVATLIDNSCTGPSRFSLLDHHLSALWLNEYSWATVSESEFNYSSKSIEKTSGTYMFFTRLIDDGYLRSNDNKYDPLNIFANTVRKYDTWLWKEEYNDDFPKKWNDLFYILGKERFIEKIVNLLKNDSFEFSEFDKTLLSIEQEKIDKYIKKKSKEMIVKNVLEYKAGIIFAEQYISELGNEICNISSDLDFVIIIDISKAISYRTTKDKIDLSHVASIYGGGGHPKSAGSPIDNNIRHLISNMLFT